MPTYRLVELPYVAFLLRERDTAMAEIAALRTYVARLEAALHDQARQPPPLWVRPVAMPGSGMPSA